MVLHELPRYLARSVVSLQAPSASEVTLRLARGITVVWGGTDRAAQKSRELAVLMRTHARTYNVSAPGTGVTGTVGLVAMGWGTQVTLDLAKVRGPLTCELIAVSKSGQQRVVLTWRVPPAGDGVPGHPAHLLVEGGAAIAASQLAQLVIKVVQGRTLLTIPV